MKNNITYKPLSNLDRLKLQQKNYPLTTFMLNTGLRINEVHTALNSDWKSSDNYLDIRTKKSGLQENRIWLNKEAMSSLKIMKETMMNKSLKTLQRAINKISEDEGIEFTSHNLRATFATSLFQRKIDIVSIQNAMNHKDISTTASYIKLDESDGMNTVESLLDDTTYEGMTRAELIKELHTLRNKITSMENKNDL